MGEAEGAPPPARRGLKVIKGCGALVLALLALFLGLSIRASVMLKGRVAALRELIAAERARPTERPVRTGEAPVEGNAVADYQVFQWVLGAPPEWQPVDLPATDFARDDAKSHGIDLGAAFPKLDEVLDGRLPLPPETARFVERYAGLERHVRDGLRKRTCDWAPRYEAGVAVPIPNLMALRSVGNLLAIQAMTTPDAEESVRLGLELVAFGDDLGRSCLLINQMLGIAVRTIGLRSLARTMTQRPLTRAAYERIASALAQAERFELARAMVGERISMGVELATMSGRPFEPSRAPKGAEGAAARLGPLFFEREWAGYLAAMDRLEQVAAIPYGPAYDAAATAADDEVATGSYIFARIAIPSLGQARISVDEGNALVSLTRMLAAAHLHRLEHGAFPASSDALAPYLGGAVPADPFDGKPLRASLQGDVLRCYSVDQDLKDDGGANPGDKVRGPDLLLTTKVPPG